MTTPECVMFGPIFTVRYSYHVRSITITMKVRSADLSPHYADSSPHVRSNFIPVNRPDMISIVNDQAYTKPDKTVGQTGKN